MSRRILFALHDWGLGHATRSLLLIRALLDRGDQVTVLSAPGGGLQLLRAELGNRCDYYPYRDIPKPFSRWPAMFYVRMSLSMPLVWARFKLEHRLTERLVAERGFDCVVSDSRFGVWSRAVPSYCILHSLRQIIPGRPRWMETLVEWGQRRLLRHYTKVLVPDAAGPEGLSGDLGHHPTLDWGKGRLCYIGPLASVQRMDLPVDIDVFFSVSGIEPQRSLLGKKVLDALPWLQGRIVVTLGDPSRAGETFRVGNATVHGYLDRRAQSEMLNRAAVVMTRSGYTTLMELAELGKRALFVPTPGQSEQEYLAKYHAEQGHVWSTTQDKLDLGADLERARQSAGVPRLSSADSVSRFLAALE